MEDEVKGGPWRVRATVVTEGALRLWTSDEVLR